MNRPEHVAFIFKSIIYQYAGYFKKIVFSIIDDHNTGGRVNPNGNFIPFQQVLDKLVASPPTTQTIGMSLGPYRFIRSKATNTSTAVKEFILGDVSPCVEAAHCENRNDKSHCRLYSHPPLCPLGSECTEEKNDVHCQMFIHRKQCPNRGQCPLTDRLHLADFDHPEYCPEGSLCTNMKTDHLNFYRHVPTCRHGLECYLRLKRDAQHLAQYRHCQRPCKFGGNCALIHDQKHTSDEQHPFNTPCPYTPFSCKLHTKFLERNNSTSQNEMDEMKKHCYRYSHVCPWGRLCRDQSEEHLSMTIHIARHICSNGSKCHQMTDEDHLDSFSHFDVRDIRVLCRRSGSECGDRGQIQHVTKYRHNYISDDLGTAAFFGLNKQINFIENWITMNQWMSNYVETTCKQSWKRVSIPNDLLEWIRALPPIHRCIGPIFESILVHGNVMSSSYMEKLKSSTFVSDVVNQHHRVRTILAGQGAALQEKCHQFIKALVSKEFLQSKSLGNQEESNSEQIEYRIHKEREVLKGNLSEFHLNEICSCARQIVKASINLSSKKTGIQHIGDLTFGTHQQIFSILGPHTGQYYGDIVIIFKRDVMLHPDSNFTMQAATMYKEKTYKCRPWLKNPGSVEKDQIQQFHSTKLHCSIPGYEKVTALELMAITGAQRKTISVDLNNILHRWKQIDSHQVIEAHLPQLIPLSYIEHIYMPQNVFQSLSPEAQKTARELFPRNLTVTEHIVDLAVDRMAFLKPDESRKDYENYVIDETIKSIQKQQERNSLLSRSRLLNSYGMTITIPATDFEDIITNPSTIKQSYKQYSNQSYRTTTSDDNVYIYWKALRGDFMLILTNEMIKIGTIQPNLVYLTCYIAAFATNVNNNSNYNEFHSYIDDSSPRSHKIVLEEQRFKVGSNEFHRGCNSNDYALYCLKLNFTKRQVSLMNAGVNGIYNHTILKHTFKDNELDLSSLDYIHVSAGRQSVSIRNLVISRELIPEAHPKFDKEFLNHSTNTSLQETTITTTHDKSSSSDSTITNDGSKGDKNKGDNTISSYVLKPVKKIWRKIWVGDKNGSDEDENDQAEESQEIERLERCSKSIYCLDQYSPEKSSSHNQTYSHPCRFSELCRNIHNASHCIQFTHSGHNVPRCQYDMNCSKITDPVHRCSYRHTNLPDYLVPCRYQQQCRDSTWEHRKKYFHGENINRPTVVSNISNGKNESTDAQRPFLSISNFRKIAGKNYLSIEK